ncbi:MAG TPA: glycosyltransferase family 39 protein [Thermoanaerobaculia bacterium]|jgi:multisubunit Na+/H+ antiporter MnhF subunit|nr:glycosyltransferase family 39 protein [Thermoanaerobaculia bacterium]
MQLDAAQEPGTGPVDERLVRRLLLAVLAVAFAIRLWLLFVLPRYYDDHYVLNNISTFLAGSLVPRHSYYGSLSYLPQAIVLGLMDFLYSVTRIDAFRVHGMRVEGFTIEAFRVTRLFVVAYSLVSIVMIYKVGRRLFSPTVGVIAAAVLAAYPQHVRSAGQLKPDMLALLFTLVALYWTAAAVQDPRRPRFLLAGVGVGLATAAKYTGASSALPLTVWALWTGFRDRRRWGLLALAGLTSVATFFALNPWVGTVLRFVFRLTGFYENKARVAKSDHMVVLRRELDFVFVQHGWILLAFLLLGIAMLLYRLWRGPDDQARAAALLPLTLCLLYPAAHAAGMTFFRSQNLLPAMGGMALVCAYAIACCGEWLFRRRDLRAFVMIVPVALLLVPPVDYTYIRLVRRTWSVAEKALRARLAPLANRHVAYEPADARLSLSDGWLATARTGVPSLAALPPAWLDLTDAEVFPLPRTRGSKADFYRSREQRVAKGCRVEVRPKLFRSRGTPLLLLLHPWKPARPPVRLGLERSGASVLSARLPPGLSAGEVVSFELLRPTKERSTREVLLQPGGQSLPFEFAGRHGRRTRFLTPRFRLTGGLASIQLPASGRADPQSFELQLRRWSEDRTACGLK